MPQCNQTFDDATDFCVDDGTRLVTTGNQNQSRVVVSWDDQSSIGEIPTQYVSIPQQPATPQTTPSNPNWLYAVIGGLVAVVIMGGAYLLLVGSREKDIEKTRLENSAPTTNAASSNVVNGMLNNIGANRNGFATNSASANAPANVLANSPFMPANAPAANANRGNSPVEKRFRRTFYGTVDNDGIEMYLERNGSSLTGKVHPNHRNAVIYVEGYVENDGSFQMDEKSDIGVVTGVYRGRFNSDGTVNGTWSKPGGEKARPLFLRRQ